MAKTFLVTVTNDLNQDQRMHRICLSLFEEGYSVLLLGRERSSSTPLLDHPFDQKRLKCFFNKGFLFYLEYNIRAFIFVLSYKPEVIYSVDIDTLLCGGLASRFLKNKLIHDAHEYFVEVPELEGKRLKKWIWNSIGRRFIPKAELCFTVNQELSEILTKLYKNKFHVVRSAPQIVQIDSVEKKKDGRIVILYQGVLNKGRGLEQAIEAVSNLDQDVILKIAGEGDLSSELRALVDKLDASRKVQFLGWLSPNKLKEETRKADIGLNLLSGTSLNYRYSLANKFFDYMHAEIPSVNMDFPVYRRICDEFEVGECIDVLKVDKIQKALKSMITDTTKMIRMREACRAAKMKYNWGSESRKLIELVERVF